MAAEEVVADKYESTDARNGDAGAGPSTAPAESAVFDRGEAIVDLDDEEDAAMMDLDAEEDMLEVLDVDAMDRPDEGNPPETDEDSNTTDEEPDGKVNFQQKILPGFVLYAFYAGLMERT